MKSKVVKEKRQQNRLNKLSLRVVGVEFLPVPGVEQKLAKLYELLLAHNSKEG